MLLCLGRPGSLAHTCIGLITVQSSPESSFYTTPPKSLSSLCRWNLREQAIVKYNTELKALTVQQKALEVVKLESSNQVGKRIISGIPAGQLSFLLKAGTNTLPTPLNLKRWRYKTDPSATLRPQTTYCPSNSFKLPDSSRSRLLHLET